MVVAVTNACLARDFLDNNGTRSGCATNTHQRAKSCDGCARKMYSIRSASHTRSPLRQIITANVAWAMVLFPSPLSSRGIVVKCSPTSQRNRRLTINQSTNTSPALHNYRIQSFLVHQQPAHKLPSFPDAALNQTETSDIGAFATRPPSNRHED